MNGTTLGRSNITKEKIQMMENLSRYSSSHPYNGQYKHSAQRENMEMLMQNLGMRSHHKEKAPQAYFVLGLIVGAIITLAITTFVSLLINLSTPKDDIVVPKKVVAESSEKFSFIPPDNVTAKTTPVSTTSKEYTVKSGDTLESIVIRFYGSFDLSKVNAIQAANKMANPNALSIGQKLIIPMN